MDGGTLKAVLSVAQRNQKVTDQKCSREQCRKSPSFFFFRFPIQIFDFEIQIKTGIKMLSTSLLNIILSQNAINTLRGLAKYKTF